jgi:glycosyltransferase involved in cell wall biosynthesis
MRIAVNTRLLLKGKLEGIGWFTHETLRRIVVQHPEHEFLFFFDRPFDPSFIFAKNVKPIVFGPQARHPILFNIWFNIAVPFMLRKHKADLFLSPDGMMSLKTKVPSCIVMHDLAFEHYPQHLKKIHQVFYRKNSPLYAKKATRIVTVSEFSKNDIATRYHVPLDKIDVTYNGAHEMYCPLNWEEKEAVKKQYANGCEYFVFAGALHPRKNVVNLLKAFIVFKKRQRSNMKLVVVGRMAWNYEEIATLRETMPFKEDVKWVGYLNVDELSKVIGGAYALVYPSLFEGFGIPILESLQCNVPAIISNTSSMPEVGGDAALLVNPNDVDDIAAKMEIVYKDETLRKRLIEAAPMQVEKFQWQKSADKLWESLMKCVGM